jgi:hypothetical protein
MDEYLKGENIKGDKVKGYSHACVSLLLAGGAAA